MAFFWGRRFGGLTPPAYEALWVETKLPQPLRSPSFWGGGQKTMDTVAILRRSLHADLKRATLAWANSKPQYFENPKSSSV